VQVLHSLLASHVRCKYCLELTLEGAGAGIGRAVALRLIADGIKKVALIDLFEAHLADIAAKIVEL